ncbi:MAG TPA: serine hydrolase domain-containing protein [Herpetosiphonaceae bacterium]
MRYPRYRIYWRSALLCLCVLLRAPSTTQAGSTRPGETTAPSADFQTIDAYVAAQMKAMHIPGVALGIVHGTEVVHVQGFGIANPAGQPMTAQTPMILGSTSKSFTALAIMQLVESGKLSLDAPVQRYLPWYQVGTPAASSTITVRHLLNQVSGIPTRAVGESLTGTGDETLEQVVRALKDVALTAPVGSTYQYSNLNYTTLGLIVETVSGQSYEAYVQQHIFEPLHMRQSFVSEPEAMQQGMATGYRWWFGVPVPSHLPYLRGSLPAGFLISSAQDMAHYLVAQLNDGRYLETSVLSAGGIAQLHHPAAMMTSQGGRGDAYGMGWVISSSGEPSIWHAGDTANFHADMIILPRKQVGVVVLMNVNGNLARATNAQGVIAHGVQRLLLGQQPPTRSTFWQRYLVFDAALVLCSALVLWSLVRLLRRSNRPIRRRLFSLLPGVILPLLWEIALPIWLLLGFPTRSGATWSLILLYFPDLGHWLLGLCVLLLATGSFRVILARTRPRMQYTDPAPAITAQTGDYRRIV